MPDKIINEYRRLNSEDQRAFRRWFWTNAVVGAILVAGLIALTSKFTGDGSVCPAPAMCESFFATLECELLDRRRFKTQAEARLAVFSFIEGPRRRHSSIGYLSPIEYERRLATNPDARQSAVVLAAVKMLWGGSGETYPSLH